eukprot:1360064-Ditylum_brightwellii.AAC.1
MKSANEWYDESIFEVFGKAERATDKSGGLICIGQDECNREVRALTHLREKPSSPKDIFSKEEIFQSKGDGGLLHISLEKFDGEVGALTHLHKKPRVLQRTSLPMKRYCTALICIFYQREDDEVYWEERAPDVDVFFSTEKTLKYERKRKLLPIQVGRVEVVYETSEVVENGFISNDGACKRVLSPQSLLCKVDWEGTFLN